MSRNIYQRINAVREQVEGYLQKERTIGSGSYAYKVVTHDQVTAACRSALVKNGVLVSPSVVKSNISPAGTTTSKGVPHIRYEATYKIDFINIDEPADRHDVIIEAHAIDEGDKAPGKALSYATKYAMLKLFSFETGEDEESRQPDAAGVELLEKALSAMQNAKTVGEFRSAYKAAFELFQGNKDAIKKIQEVHDLKMAEAKRKQAGESGND